ncbi:unnamed protein product [Clonostachys chloroleuca]|uniref:Uncharacterized protein n=1 Tax=Clonostachys chloroleuca TaxID=1926264 RepID=A0AA35PTP2_9HYPO|nr:unnamed protein product [Clonostachys chloroleuca]
MSSHLDKQEMTIATGGFFLASSLGRVTAVTTVNVLLQPFFTRRLDAVVDVPNKAELTGELRKLVVGAFVGSLKTTYSKISRGIKN